ncbi:penicillin acylase family protein [Pseudozobellia sp. WGM2]|uniref:penicillin acylase family protein n=1 Tax=Pseudozobellia sp. WGM2 TaxID=2787625 RepID=UPI001ADF3D9A|nr:penicillin acylase family protein [Pseudozobellia sp. WGM2]
MLTYKSGLLALKDPDKTLSKVNVGKDLVIKIDTFGIPYIYSNEDNDLAYGLGFMHAKDRYFQMELMSRVVKGELSSILGERVVSSDKFWKPYEFNKKSKEILEEYKTESPAFYSYLISYCEGVNEYLNNNEIDDPLYKIFGLKPAKWKPEYSLLTTWYMSKNLAYFDYHIAHQELLDNLPKEIFDILYPQRFDDLETILPAKKFKTNKSGRQSFKNRSINEVRHFSSNFNTDIGSNNWVINSKKSKGMAPLIVNDPHLSLTLPGAFYEASIIGKNLKAYGFSIPGVPLIISGHNDNISWGITNGEWDLTDRYLLTTKKDSLYLFNGNWVPFQEKQYRIEVRGKEDEKIIVKRTVHGKVIKKDSNYYAQKWYPSEKSYSTKALFDVMQAKKYSEFKNALSTYDYPPQNFIYADINDTIGIVCAGKLPKRPLGFNGGLLDGTREPFKEEFVSTQWETSNPKKNYLFSANQLPVQNDYYFGAHWNKDDYRVSHIDSLLNKKDLLNTRDMKLMQLDKVDISFFHLKKVFEDYSFDEKYAYLKKMLSNWNGNMKSNSKEAFIYEIFRRSTIKEARRYANEELKVQKAPSMKSFLNYLSSDICNEGKFCAKKDILVNIIKRVDSTVTLENEKGNKEQQYNHNIFIKNISMLPGFGYDLPNPGGNKNTINVNSYAHPVFRSIYEMKKGSIEGHTIMAGGQSGKMNSANYSNQINDWRDGKYKKTQFKENPKKLKNISTTLSFN